MDTATPSEQNLRKAIGDAFENGMIPGEVEEIVQRVWAERKAEHFRRIAEASVAATSGR